jgi:hypothetical protein
MSAHCAICGHLLSPSAALVHGSASYCKDAIGCRFRARLRLGLPLWLCRRERGRELAERSKRNSNSVRGPWS